jgi:hypothetical protein
MHPRFSTGAPDSPVQFRLDVQQDWEKDMHSSNPANPNSFSGSALAYRSQDPETVSSRLRLIAREAFTASATARLIARYSD